jgi:hypothetical protein
MIMNGRYPCALRGSRHGEGPPSAHDRFQRIPSSGIWVPASVETTTAGEAASEDQPGTAEGETIVDKAVLSPPTDPREREGWYHDAQVEVLLCGVVVSRDLYGRLRRLTATLLLLLTLLLANVSLHVGWADPIALLGLPPVLGREVDRLALSPGPSKTGTDRIARLEAFVQARSRALDLIRYLSAVTPESVETRHVSMSVAEAPLPADPAVSLALEGQVAEPSVAERYVSSLRVLAPNVQIGKMTTAAPGSADPCRFTVISIVESDRGGGAG